MIRVMRLLPARSRVWVLAKGKKRAMFQALGRSEGAHARERSTRCSRRTNSGIFVRRWAG